jgi:hypothetical protein
MRSAGDYHVTMLSQSDTSLFMNSSDGRTEVHSTVIAQT